jgi:hypothetical protein
MLGVAVRTSLKMRFGCGFLKLRGIQSCGGRINSDFLIHLFILFMFDNLFNILCYLLFYLFLFSTLFYFVLASYASLCLFSPPSLSCFVLGV